MSSTGASSGNNFDRRFVDEICQPGFGGYARFFRRLTFHYVGFWSANFLLPFLVMDNHSCVATGYLGLFTHILFLLLLYGSLAEETSCALKVLGAITYHDDDGTGEWWNLFNFNLIEALTAMTLLTRDADERDLAHATISSVAGARDRGGRSDRASRTSSGVHHGAGPVPDPGPSGPLDLLQENDCGPSDLQNDSSQMTSNRWKESPKALESSSTTTGTPDTSKNTIALAGGGLLEMKGTAVPTDQGKKNSKPSAGPASATGGAGPRGQHLSIPVGDSPLGVATNRLSESMRTSGSSRPTSQMSASSSSSSIFRVAGGGGHQTQRNASTISAENTNASAVVLSSLHQTLTRTHIRLDRFVNTLSACCEILCFQEVLQLYQRNENFYLLLRTFVWKLDVYLDVVFILIARNCGSTLWWASFAVFLFGNVALQIFLHLLFACSDCDGQMGRNMGFLLYDFALVNKAVMAMKIQSVDGAGRETAHALARSRGGEDDGEAIEVALTEIVGAASRSNDVIQALEPEIDGILDGPAAARTRDTQAPKDHEDKEGSRKISSSQVVEQGDYSAAASSLEAAPNAPSAPLPLDLQPTLSATVIRHCIMIEKCFLGDLAQMLIQTMFLLDFTTPNNSIVFLSVFFAGLNFGLNVFHVLAGALLGYRERQEAARVLEMQVDELRR